MNNPQGPEGAPAAPPHDPWSDRPDWSGWSDVPPWPARSAPTDRREQFYAPGGPEPGWGWDGWDGWEPEPAAPAVPVTRYAPPPPPAADRRTAAKDAGPRAYSGTDGNGADGPDADADADADDDVYLAVHTAPEFQRVRRQYRRFVVPAALAFLAWYLSYVVAATAAPELMGRRVLGPVNVALLAGLGQFATAFLLTWAYARHARLRRDPAALDLRWDIAMRTRRSDGYVDTRTDAAREPGR
ncbi:DUF485 domain-containing protein [Streptomyces sp. 184]|uniref:DUF485 domain-containing protein n=1 Tax=Streptomyces sp. 184 TaxID=1827526 RepID=UPI003892C89A